MSGPSYVFRCDATEKSGLGHFSRSLNLARWIRAEEEHAQVSFWGDLSAFARATLERHEIPWKGLEASMEGWCVIVDSYEVAAPYLAACKKHFGRVVIFDDYADRDVSPADLVINYSFNAERLITRYPRAALGIGYLCPKPELVQVRRERAQCRKESLSPLMVTLGATDAAIEALPRLARRLDEVLTDTEIRLFGPRPTGITSTRNRLVEVGLCDRLEDHYREVGAVICAGGVTKYESAFCLVPSASLSLNAGQADEIQGFHERGLTFPLGGTDSIGSADFLHRLSAFLEDRAAREKQLSRALIEFRSDSASRLAARITKL